MEKFLPIKDLRCARAPGCRRRRISFSDRACDFARNNNKQTLNKHKVGSFIQLSIQKRRKSEYKFKNGEIAIESRAASELDTNWVIAGSTPLSLEPVSSHTSRETPDENFLEWEKEEIMKIMGQ